MNMKGDEIESKRHMMIVLLMVTSLDWIGWFPFFLYDTEFMGCEGGAALGVCVGALRPGSLRLRKYTSPAGNGRSLRRTLVVGIVGGRLVWRH
ncbi:unnamed protein product [Linum trigynum]|uniref:Transmembrane protein n=1 Tax=Linum trigynum TaxID=586398 RepID=A0AAV2GGF0_9ROSI